MTTNVTLETWRARMSEDMRVHDFRPRTQEAYLRGTRMFLDWVKKGPADLGDGDIRAYFGRYPRPMGTSAPNLLDGDESCFSTSPMGSLLHD